MADSSVETIKDKMKEKIIEKLANHDWLDRMRLKCRSYIKQNGTKTTTVDEIMDNIIYEAKKTFPANVQAEIEEECTKEILQRMVYL